MKLSYNKVKYIMNDEAFPITKSENPFKVPVVFKPSIPEQKTIERVVITQNVQHTVQQNVQQNYSPGGFELIWLWCLCQQCSHFPCIPCICCFFTRR